AAARLSCSNNLKQIGLATVNCADQNTGRLPPSIGLYSSNGTPSAGNSNGGFFLHISPFIEQGNMYRATSATPDPDRRNGNNQTYSQWTPAAQNAVIKTYACPSDYTYSPSQGGYASYGVNGQLFRHNYNWGGVGLATFPGSLPDGTSNTIMATE